MVLPGYVKEHAVDTQNIMVLNNFHLPYSTCI